MVHLSPDYESPEYKYAKNNNERSGYSYSFFNILFRTFEYLIKAYFEDQKGNVPV